MEKELCFLMALTLTCYWVESAPSRLDELKFDLFNSDESYNIKEEDLDDFLHNLDNIDQSKTLDDDKSDINTSGFKKKYSKNTGIKSKHDIEDLKKFFKLGGLHDKGIYEDNEAYAVSDGIAAKAVGISGNEDRKYKKGTKTHGFHRIQHKNEFKKDKEIYEDDETSGVIKKTGIKGFGVGAAAGVGQSKYNFHHDHDKGVIGKQGYLDKGNSDQQYNGYSDSQGFDTYFNSN